jgi:regulator of sigma E protease
VSVLVAIVALCVVIIIHEFGHYIAAVWTGMKVDRFSVFGIGPAILKLGTWRGTEFVIGAIPFGAYVLIRGMEREDGVMGVPDDAPQQTTPAPEADPKRDEDAKPASPNFRDKPLLSRIAVLAGGPGANYLAAIVLFFTVFAVGGLPGPIEAITVSDVSESSPAAQAGVEPGDELLRIGETWIDPQLRGTDVKGALDQIRGSEFELVVVRENEPLDLRATLPADADALLGITYGARAGPRQAVPITTAFAAGVREPFTQTAAQLEGLWMLINRRLDADPMGPVGIVTHIARSADAGIIPFVWTAALISTLLGLFNLLPLPALDGGRLAFLGFEAVAGRPASAYVEERVHGYGMLALLLLIAVITVGDVRRIWPG